MHPNGILEGNIGLKAPLRNALEEKKLHVALLRSLIVPLMLLVVFLVAPLNWHHDWTSLLMTSTH